VQITNGRACTIAPYVYTRGVRSLIFSKTLTPVGVDSCTPLVYTEREAKVAESMRSDDE